VNWLRAKNRHDRWVEEMDLLRHEMSWTLSFFAFQRLLWEGRAITSEGIGEKGHQAYALKQADMWKRFESEGMKVLGNLKAIDIVQQ
jgi:hypothetical protein